MYVRPVLIAPLVLAGALAQKPGAPVTFTEHVAPIVFEQCACCHRPGEIGPFSLLTYDDLRKRARTILKVVESRYMPPWNPVAGHGEFVGERRLTDAQIATIRAWVAGGRVQGDPGALPALPDFGSGWALGEPDLVVSMADAFEVPASGPDIYRNFVVPVALDEDKWVTAYELRPGARAVLHHSLVLLDDGAARRMDGRDGKPGFAGMRGGSGMLGIWAVGATPHHLPAGLAMKLPKGHDIVLSSHFHLSGKPEREKTAIGLYFADKPPTRSLVPLQMPPAWGSVYGLDIPAGARNYVVDDWQVLPVDCQAVEVSSHAHYTCQTMKAEATLPNGDLVSLFYIDDWDFNWQGGYTYKAPVPLPRGTRIDVRLSYDNSSDNPHNPNDPPKRIRFGRATTDEMARVTLTLVPADEKDAAALRRACDRRARMGVVYRRRLMRHDANGDGRLTADELPARARGLVRRYDANGDGILTERELEQSGTSARRRRR